MLRKISFVILLFLLCVPAAAHGATSEELQLKQEFSKTKLLNQSTYADEAGNPTLAEDKG